MNVRDAIQCVYDERGELKPQHVVDAARDPADEVGRVLHPLFEWDDSAAGELYRRDQARNLIRKFRITYRPSQEPSSERTVRAWQSVQRETGRSYEPTELVAADPFTRQLVLREMEREWRALYRRYEMFDEFLNLVRADVAV